MVMDCMQVQCWNTAKYSHIGYPHLCRVLPNPSQYHLLRSEIVQVEDNVLKGWCTWFMNPILKLYLNGYKSSGMRGRYSQGYEDVK